MERQLLCTFTTQNYMVTTVRSILDSFEIMYSKIYIFEDFDNREDIFYTYNIKGLKKEKDFLSNTISIHRKKETNTFYTINALNYLIQEVNNGVLDTSYNVSWENYENMMLLVNDNILKKIRLKLKEVFHLN